MTHQKKRLVLCVLLLIIACFFAAVPAMAEEPEGSSAAEAAVLPEGPITNETELRSLLNYYRENRINAFNFTVEQSYFDTIRANNFIGFSVVALQCGLKDQSLRYYNSGEIEITKAIWVTPAAVQCETAEEIRDAIHSFLENGNRQFQIICAQELYDQIKNTVFAYMAQDGIEDFKLQNTYTEPRIMYFSDIRKVSIPYTVISDINEYRNAIDNMWQKKAKHFYIVMDPELFAAVRSDRSQLDMMERSSQMESWRSKYNNYYCRYEYTEVTYSDDPRILCSTQEDILNGIRQMGASGAKDFRLIMTKELFSEVRENQFAILSQLTAEAGMSGGDMKYSLSNNIVYYENAVIQSDIVKLTTAEEAMAYVRECAARGDTEIPLFCTPELYSLLIGKISSISLFGTGDTMAPLFDVVEHAGIFKYSFNYSSASRIINLYIDDYYPGTDIVRAVLAGDDSALTLREKETLEQARKDADKCKTDDPLGTARAIHDLLCGRVVYTDDERTDEDDTAIGAILNGEANCDGYADAFYLIGTLAGLEVGYQHGDSYNLYLSHDLFDSVTHMWNVIRIDGSWRLVDVTWDDGEDGIRYTWFNLGADRAKRMHIWNDETSVALMPETDLTVRPDNEFAIGAGITMDDAMKEIRAKGMTGFEIIYSDAESETHRDDMNVLRKNATDSFTYMWNDKMLTLTVWNYR